MTEEHQDRAELDKAEIVDELVLVTYQDAAVVLQPGKESFDLPATLVASEFASILRLGFLAIAPVGCDEFDLALGKQPLVERVRVIGFVTDEPLRRLVYESSI